MNIELINKTIATKLFGLVEGKDFGEWNEHDWKVDKDGVIDDMAFAFDNHNGPQCIRCWYYYCERCQDGQDGPEEPCKIELKDYTDESNFLSLIEKIEDKVYVNFSVHGGLASCLLTSADAEIYGVISGEKTMSLALARAVYEAIEKGYL